MDIRGLSKLTLLDYPEHIACTLFTGGCNFRCPFCHNGGLVLDSTAQPQIDDSLLFDFLNARKGKLEGVCITGGEPTIQQGLSDILKKIKAMGFLTKLDTNGYQPAVLLDLISKGLLDMVAMDIKNAPGKYAETAGLNPRTFDLGRINESISILKNSGVAHEFRTTIVREYHTKIDMAEISEWLSGPSAYYLQAYKDAEDIIYKYNKTSAVSAPTDLEMLTYLSIVRTHLPNSHIRGSEE